MWLFEISDLSFSQYEILCGGRRRGMGRTRVVKVMMQLIPAPVKHAGSIALAWHFSPDRCRLLRQLETNCCELPPRDVWWKQEVARGSHTELHLFLCKPPGDSTSQLCNGAEVMQELTDQTLTFPLCTWGVALLVWTTEIMEFLTPPSIAARIPELFTYPSLSSSSPALTLETEGRFHGEWILSAAVKDTSLASCAATGAGLSWSLPLWGNNEHRQHFTLVFTLPGVQIVDSFLPLPLLLSLTSAQKSSLAGFESASALCCAHQPWVKAFWVLFVAVISNFATTLEQRDVK